MKRLKVLPTPDAMAIVGGLSNPSKMPCASYSIPPAACGVGSRLRDVPGSVCADCYACKGLYPMGPVQRAMYRRLAAVRVALSSETAGEAWVDAMVAILGRKRSDVFRWHDAGDVQGVRHLRLIAMVAERLPNVRFWLPTREYDIVRKYLETFGPFPRNLTVRLSAHMVDGRAPTGFGLPTSGVHTRVPAPDTFVCGAYTRNGHCGDCRACWDPAVATVSYPLH